MDEQSCKKIHITKNTTHFLIKNIQGQECQAIITVSIKQEVFAINVVKSSIQ